MLFWLSYYGEKGVMRLNQTLLYPVGVSDSCMFAARFLNAAGIALADHPSPEVTHLLLDVPTSQDDSNWRELLRMLPETVTVIGGRFRQTFPFDCKIIDLLKDPFYLSQNAAITAHCALRAAAPYLKTTFADSPALILGWGRIGKCLAKLLSDMGCHVTVAARKEYDRAILISLGYQAVDFSQIQEVVSNCRILFNTVPDLALQPQIQNSWKDWATFALKR